MSTGWTYSQVGEEFDLPRLKAMQSYWESNPPLHVMVSRYLGIKPKEQPKPDNEGLLDALVAFQQG